MIFAYGAGAFFNGQTKIEGLITLGEHRVYLRTETEDLTSTYVPLEKIDYVRLQADQVHLHVKPTISSQFIATFSGEKSKIQELARDIVQRRGFKKKFLRNEWYEINP